LKGGGGVLEPKQHNSVFVVFVSCSECRFSFFAFLHLYSVIGFFQV